MVRRLAIFYFGGAVGAVANSLAIWLLGAAGVTASLGVAMNPALSWPWLAPRILWGGLWGLGLIALPRRAGGLVARGLVYSLLPTTAQLLYFFPVRGDGWLGLERGELTPLMVLAANALWGWVLARVGIAAGES